MGSFNGLMVNRLVVSGQSIGRGKTHIPLFRGGPRGRVSDCCLRCGMDHDSCCVTSFAGPAVRLSP